jgi:hypothetical protein
MKIAIVLFFIDFLKDNYKFHSCDFPLMVIMR